MFCRRVDGADGGKDLAANQVYFGGPAQWRGTANSSWADGYWFDVVATNRDKAGASSTRNGGQVSATYHFTLRKMEDPAAKISGTIVYETRGSLVDGKLLIQANDDARSAANLPLPYWVSLEP
ncbi:MAG TPA: hypothetical protein VM580_24015 [Labilithrix sp.]|nr:hypothetical protein [Labilithrix sp.]